MPYANIGPIVVHYPQRVETNAELHAQFPEWDIPLIEEKTGIASRHIAAPNETSSDLAVAAAKKLFHQFGISPESIDFVLLCTQTPDYPLPTTSCLIQDRLGLPTTTGAIDFNLGCSGFVYGLSLAEGLIQSGQAKRILLLTAETYSKFIDEHDRSLRTIFGDAAAATLIESGPEPTLNAFQFGTDGSGADTLLVADGGMRPTADAITPRHRKRWKSRLYMDGPSLMSFTVVAVPTLIQQILQRGNRTLASIDYLLLHQATLKMLEQLRITIGVEAARLPIRLRDCGNTVSSTLPILIHDMRASGELSPGKESLLVGFGVGWSWAGCIWRETFA